MSQPNQLNILIVEDDPNWRDRLRRLLERMLKDLHGVANPTEHVYEAQNVKEAQVLIEQKPIFNLVTMDIDLEGERSGDGLKLLGLLRQKQPGVVSVVISGRGAEKSIWTSSVNEHQVFMVLEKDSSDDIKSSLQAAMQYASAVNLRELGQYDQAIASLQKAAQQFPKLGVFTNALSELRVLAETHARDQMTGLPGLDAVHKRINGMRSSGRTWEIASITIDHHKEFREAYTSFNSAEVTKFVAQTLKHALDEVGGRHSDNLFVGYVGENEFLVLAYSNNDDPISSLQASAERKFNATVKSLYRAPDIDAGWGGTPKFDSSNIMRLHFNRKRIEANAYAGVGIDSFLEEVWKPGTGTEASDAPTSW